MPATGDTAILRFGSDGKWHWFFLTPSASSMLGFDSSAVAVTPAVAGFATASQGVKADSALQSFTETDPVASAAVTAEAATRASADTAAIATAKAFSIQRANHTGTQLLATIIDAGTAASHASSDFATAAQGALAATALQSQAGLILTADTGWTANNTSGDKTAALSSYSNGLNSTIIAALNLAAANSGTALGAALDVLVVVVKKLAALETTLVASKIPNA